MVSARRIRRLATFGHGNRWPMGEALTGRGEHPPFTGKRSHPWAGTRRKIPAPPKIVTNTLRRSLASRQSKESCRPGTRHPPDRVATATRRSACDLGNWPRETEPKPSWQRPKKTNSKKQLAEDPPILLLPRPKQPSHRYKLPQMVSVMVCDQQGFPQDGLPVSMRDRREQAGRVVRDQLTHRLEIGAK